MTAFIAPRRHRQGADRVCGCAAGVLLQSSAARCHRTDIRAGEASRASHAVRTTPRSRLAAPPPAPPAAAPAQPAERARHPGLPKCARSPEGVALPLLSQRAAAEELRGLARRRGAGRHSEFDRARRPSGKSRTRLPPMAMPAVDTPIPARLAWPLTCSRRAPRARRWPPPAARPLRGRPRRRPRRSRRSRRAGSSTRARRSRTRCSGG